VRGAVALDAALAELDDSLVDLAAEREVLAARLKATSDPAVQAKIKELQAKLPKPDALAAKLQQHEQAAKAGEELTQARLLAKIAALRKLLAQVEGKSGAPPAAENSPVGKAASP